ncbi:MAG: hypothetical protein II921_05775 [Treponema sp.]|nr:hypothetical protein [Treponema sp.]
MNRKPILELAVLIFFPAALFADFGFGVGGGYDFSTSPSAFMSASFRADTTPWCFNLNVHSDCALSFSADNWIIHKKLADNISTFVLWGFSVEFQKDISTDNSDFEAAFGSRAGAGMDFFIFKRHLELSTQIVWDMQVGIQGNDDGASFLFRPVNFPCSLALRFWF